METVEELVARFRAGDPDAAGELHRRFADEMLALVRRRLTDQVARGALDSEGIVQDGFRSFFSAIGKPNFDPRVGSIGGLLATIVRRKMLVQLRRKFPGNIDPAVLGGETDVVGLMLNLTEVEVEASRREAVAEILDDLTDLERRVVARHLDAGSEPSRPEIARECGCTETTVRASIDLFYTLLRRQSGGR